MPATAALEIMTSLHFALFIIVKNTKGGGKTVSSAEIPLKQKFMFTTEPMNIILKSSKTRPCMNQGNALPAAQ